MTRILQFCAVMLVSVAALAEDPVVFRSDVSLVRVDVQVLGAQAWVAKTYADIGVDP